jgi:hypothetical protein
MSRATIIDDHSAAAAAAVTQALRLVAANGADDYTYLTELERVYVELLATDDPAQRRDNLANLLNAFARVARQALQLAALNSNLDTAELMCVLEDGLTRYDDRELA